MLRRAGASRAGFQGSRVDDALEEEVEVMRLVAAGHKDVAIARRLGVAPITVRRRAQRFCRRVGARNRAQAIAIAVREGWLASHDVEEPPSDQPLS